MRARSSETSDDDIREAVAALVEISAELVAGHVHVVKQAFEVLLGRLPDTRCLDGLEDAVNLDVELTVARRVLGDVAEELRGKHEIALVLRDAGACRLGVLVAHRGVAEIGIPRLMLALVDELAKVLGDEPVEQEAEDVCLEVPAVHRATHVLGDSPNRLVEFGLFVICCHVCCPFVVGFAPSGILIACRQIAASMPPPAVLSFVFPL